MPYTRFDNNSDDSTDEMIEVKHGYSKDHRPDLKQVMMGLTMKRIDKEQIESEKAFWHLGNQLFSCEEDACQNVEQLNKKYRFHQINFTVEAVEKYEGRGRPNP